MLVPNGGLREPPWGSRAPAPWPADEGDTLNPSARRSEIQVGGSSVLGPGPCASLRGSLTGRWDRGRPGPRAVGAALGDWMDCTPPPGPTHMGLKTWPQSQAHICCHTK